VKREKRSETREEKGNERREVKREKRSETREEK